MSTSSFSSITNIGTKLTNSITSLLPTRFHFRNSSPASPLITTAAVVVGTIGSLAFARWAWTDYQAYLGYGPGGLPYNVFGWLITTTVLRALAINTLDVRKLESDPDQRTWLPTAPEELPERKGPRPTLGRHAVPQRQMDQFAPEEIQKNLITSFESIVTKNPHLIQFKPSQYERRHEAIWVADSVDASKTPAPFGNNKNKYPLEISHVHPNADCSVHVVLAPRDAARVIRAGWGQLHGLAGSKVIPRSYVFLYAPRTQEELNVIMELVRAGIGYVTGTDLKDVQPAQRI
ncbi:hypothetical protein HRR83_005623 [Exophiala dermatitidis]|uniref:Luciferase domain-containing protein n=2 Tax=Exophiala dermatitidis TaxID=5970 RepID=H6BVX0_EXODN|nr:uncharacterized protein HMPREF1120_03276 [Exophiala dermatitidis NIH/UT8656]KAJ4508106.1 hypothetical protein HRR73_007544 [Exophiala dermatitidis]EHY55124.1 hypothetical protein HMPREF1120_03276 [Exophiala dermatitidis NIH/UT8656]KAJ4510793.1 hypothetical protein HRR75_005487 [Exophiala dermatitidis]KAJ4513179.1 hypothetical protein HRR74_005991 [Exophiala dermatitidis]KAJ4531956.1 hypothetical protein HRR77_008923 [Exophiala dermatitidis]